MAETVFSSIKRIFGEYVSATRFQNMVKEMMLKYHCITYLEEYKVTGIENKRKELCNKDSNRKNVADIMA